MVEPSTDEDAGRSHEERYADLMAELKMRLVALKADAPRVPYKRRLSLAEGILVESVCLQVRKVLELIVFANLVANRQLFETTGVNLATFWHAKKLLPRIEKVNPEFFPVPYDYGEPRNGSHSLEAYLGDGALTRAEWEVLYDHVSEVIHVKNPFSTRSMVNFGRPLLMWIERIERLLTLHMITLAGAELLIVQMNDRNGRVRVLSGQNLGRVPADSNDQ